MRWIQEMVLKSRPWESLPKKAEMFGSLKIWCREKLALSNYLVAFLLWSIILNIAGQNFCSGCESLFHFYQNFLIESETQLNIFECWHFQLLHFNIPLNQPWYQIQLVRNDKGLILFLSKFRKILYHPIYFRSLHFTFQTVLLQFKCFVF